MYIGRLLDPQFCAMKNDLTSRMFRPKTKFKCFSIALQYDDVAPDEDEHNETSAKQPVRKAPPVPQPQQAAAAASSDPPDVQPSSDDAVPPDADEKVEPGGASSQMATEREGNYDEFPAAASEVETEVRDDFMALGVA